jgi:hypothetical protein
MANVEILIGSSPKMFSFGVAKSVRFLGAEAKCGVKTAQLNG